MYKSIVDGQSSNQKLLFQQAIYTINFNNPGQTVVPKVSASFDGYIFSDENLTLNASQTYLTSTNVNDDESIRHKNLRFSWACPDSLAELCLN